MKAEIHPAGMGQQGISTARTAGRSLISFGQIKRNLSNGALIRVRLSWSPLGFRCSTCLGACIAISSACGWIKYFSPIPGCEMPNE